MANVIAERYMFYECRQLEGESLSEYLEKLRKKAENCKFGDFLEDALRDRYVCGLANDYTRKSLLAIRGLTLESAVQISLGYERGGEQKSNDEAKIKEPFKINSRQYSVSDKRQYTYFKPPPCLPELHRFKRAFCNYCNTKGHIARSCLKRNKVKNGINIQQVTQNNNNILPITHQNIVERPHKGLHMKQTVQDGGIDEKVISKIERLYKEEPQSTIPREEQQTGRSCSDNEQEQHSQRSQNTRSYQEQKLSKSNLGGQQYPAKDKLDNEQHNNPDAEVADQPYDVNYAHKTSGRQPPYKIRLMLNKDIITFEIDTGSAITIISEGTYNRCFSHIPLRTTSAIVKTYSKESLSILGKINVNVYCNGQEYTKLRVFVLKGNGANLLGRNWLNVMKLNWNLIINTSSVETEKTTISNERTRARRPISQRTEHDKDCSRAIDGGEYYEEKRDMKEKIAHARSRTTAIEEALRVEIQKLRERRTLPSPKPSERRSHIVVVRNSAP